MHIELSIETQIQCPIVIMKYIHLSELRVAFFGKERCFIVNATDYTFETLFIVHPDPYTQLMYFS